MPTLLTLPQHYTDRLPRQHKIHILQMLSDFDIVEAVVSRMSVGVIAYDTNKALASYLVWILTEVEVSPLLILRLCWIHFMTI